MASIKISELNEYTEVQDDDLFPIVDVANGETKKVKATNIGTGGKEIVMVGDENAPTKNTKLWVDTNEEGSGSVSEVTNSLAGNETYLAPSVQAVNNALNNKLSLIPISNSMIGDNQTSTYELESSLTQFYVFLNSHIYNFEMVIIMAYSGESHQYKIYNSTNPSTISYADNKLTIQGSNQCRGFLYKFVQKTTN